MRLCRALHKRKNWLFNYHAPGAAASAALYSLIESAKANDREPYHYFRFLFEELPCIDPQDTEALSALLPQNLDPSRLTIRGP